MSEWKPREMERSWSVDKRLQKHTVPSQPDHLVIQTPRNTDQSGPLKTERI